MFSRPEERIDNARTQRFLYAHHSRAFPACLLVLRHRKPHSLERDPVTKCQESIMIMPSVLLYSASTCGVSRCGSVVTGTMTTSLMAWPRSRADRMSFTAMKGQ